MRITRLQLRDFRNYEECRARALRGRRRCCCGDNGQGKTERFWRRSYLTCTGRSHRTRQGSGSDSLGRGRSADVRDRMRMRARRHARGRNSCCLQAGSEARSSRWAGSVLALSGELLGHVDGRAVFAGGSAHGQGRPGGTAALRGHGARRSCSPAYYYAMQRYNRALKQRNELLRAAAAAPVAAGHAGLVGRAAGRGGRGADATGGASILRGFRAGRGRNPSRHRRRPGAAGAFSTRPAWTNGEAPQACMRRAVRGAGARTRGG